MSANCRLEVTVLLVAIVTTCLHGLKIDFSRLYLPGRTSHHKRNVCEGNPCEPSKPFLCRDTPTCIPLKYICDGNWDCEGGFDEDPAVCNAASRPHMEDIYQFLKREKSWIVSKLFNGADLEQIAHSLSVASDMQDLQNTLGLTKANVDNLRKAFIGAEEGDERPLTEMGMLERSWPEVKFMLQSLLKSGFKP